MQDFIDLLLCLWIHMRLNGSDPHQFDKCKSRYWYI